MRELPINMVLAALHAGGFDPRTSGDGFTCRCPAHDDRSPSLSFIEASDGRVLLKCFAGCEPSAIVGALGLKLSDLFPPKAQSSKHAPKAPKKEKPKQVFATAGDAVKSFEQNYGAKAAWWVYHDAQGKEVGVVVRWNNADGTKKPPLPFSRLADGSGWTNSAMPTPRPLFGLPALLNTKPGERVCVVEGEKCVDFARLLGFTATTSAGGAGAASQSDWSPLAGRQVIVVPDRDRAGEKYAADVVRLLMALNPRPAVRIVNLWDCWQSLPDGGDVADVVAVHGGDDGRLKDIRESIEALAEAAEPIKSEEVPIHGAPVVLRLADVAAEAIHWLWNGRIARGTLTMFVGRAGDGKSFATVDWAARVTTGRDWPDGSPCECGSVLLVSGEDDPARVIRPRMEAHGANLNKIHLLSGVHSVGDDGKLREVCFTLDDLAALEKALEGIEDPALIVIDPIGSFIGGRVDTDKDNKVRSVLAPLAMLAKRFNVAVVVVAHQRKSAAAHADDMLLGSRAFTGIARSVLHLLIHPDNKERRLLLPGKSNLCRPAAGLAFTIEGNPARLKWEDGPVDMTADDVVAAQAGGEKGDRTERDDAEEWLRDFLSGGPRPAKEVEAESKAAGFSKRTIDRAKAVAGVESKTAGVGKGWVWTLRQGCQERPKECHTQKVGNLGTKPAENVGIYPKDANSDSVAPLGTPVGNLGTADLGDAGAFCSDPPEYDCSPTHAGREEPA